MPAFSPPPRLSSNQISRYGTLATWAEELGYDEAIGLLEVTGIAKSVVNIEAE